MSTRVLSIRLPVKVLAQCAVILETSGSDPSSMSMSRCIRDLLAAVVDHYQEAGLITPFKTDEEAEAHIEQTFTTVPGLKVAAPPIDRFNPPKPPGTQVIYTQSPDYQDACVEPEPEPVEQPIDLPPSEVPASDLESVRERVHAQLQPAIAAAKKEVDAKRFFGISDEAKDRVPSDYDNPPEPSVDKAPWDVSLATVEELLEIAPAVPIIALAITNNEQLTLLAARAVIKEIPKDVLVTSTGEGVIIDIAEVYSNYIGSDMDRADALPRTIIPTKEKSNGEHQSTSNSD